MTDPTPLWRTTEHADLTVLEQAWGAHRLSQILGAALGSYNRRGNVDARTAGAVLGVTEGTIRRWVRNGVPASKMQAVIDLVRPPQGAFELEHSDLIVARQNLAIVIADPQKGADLWGHKGWLDRHDLAIVKIAGAPVMVARIARHDRSATAQRNMLQGGLKDAHGHYLPPAEILTFPNYFAATIARLEILEDVYPFRVQMPEGKLSRGGSKAWLAEAPRKPLSSYRRNPRRRTRSKAQVGVRPATD